MKMKDYKQIDAFKNYSSVIKIGSKKQKAVYFLTFIFVLNYVNKENYSTGIIRRIVEVYIFRRHQGFSSQI